MRRAPVAAVGIAGLGMGFEHAKAYRDLGVRVAVLCDPDLDRARWCARQLGGADVTPDIRELAARTDVQAVSIATPDHLHAAHAAAALRGGKHVLLEKPMVTRLADARALVRLVRRTCRTLMVGNVNRFVPQFAHVRRLAATGRLGRLFHVEADYIHDMRGVYAQTPWRKDRRAPQNFWIGGGVHPVDLVRWVGGEVAEVFMYATRGSVPEFPLDSDFIAALRFRSGATGKIWATAGIRRRPEHHVRLNAYGDRGSVETDLGPEAKVYLHGEGEGRADWTRVRFGETVGHPVHAELRHFLDCARTGRRPMVDAAEGARTVAVLEAALRSVRLGRPVRVDGGHI